MAKKKTPVMLEYIDDTNNWAWYAVFENSTPEEALRWYEKENDIKKSKLMDDSIEINGLYLKDTDARAYYIELQ